MKKTEAIVDVTEYGVMGTIEIYCHYILKNSFIL